MKPIIISSIFLATAFLAKGQMYFGGNVGMNVGNLSTKVNGKDDGFRSSVGYIVAFDVNIPVGGGLLLQTGICNRLNK